VVVFNPWTVREIYEYLEEFAGTILVVDGVPHLKLPEFPTDRYGRPVKRQKIVDEIYPHLKERRDEILNRDPSYKFTAARKLRRELLVAIGTRAAESGRDVWYMGPPDYRPTSLAHKSKRNPEDVPDTARFVCVEGDSKWTELPRIVLDEPQKKTRAKLKARRLN
jgi:hypothetical protein